MTIQSRYNLLYREIETELLPMLQDEGIGLMVYNPIAGGMLSGKYSAGQTPEDERASRSGTPVRCTSNATGRKSRSKRSRD